MPLDLRNQHHKCDYTSEKGIFTYNLNIFISNPKIPEEHKTVACNYYTCSWVHTWMKRSSCMAELAERGQ
jgi:hypothetical protein